MIVRRTWQQAARAAIALTLAAAGCSSQSKAGAGPTTTLELGAANYTPLPTVPPTTVDPTEAAVLAAYRTAEAAYVSVLTHFPVQPNDPRLAQYLTGAALTTVRVNFTRDAVTGEYAVGTVEVAPIVTSVAGSTAVIDDCGFDHSVLVKHSTGATLSPANTQRTEVKVTMQLVDGTWKIADLDPVGVGCIPPAA